MNESLSLPRTPTCFGSFRASNSAVVRSAPQIGTRAARQWEEMGSESHRTVESRSRAFTCHIPRGAPHDCSVGRQRRRGLTDVRRDPCPQNRLHAVWRSDCWQPAGGTSWAWARRWDLLFIDRGLPLRSALFLSSDPLSNRLSAQLATPHMRARSTGKRSWRGSLKDGINSLRRFYGNNFRDGRKQVLCAILGHMVGRRRGGRGQRRRRGGRRRSNN